MTHIVNFPTKKAFREAVARDASRIWVNDPSIFPGACSGYLPEVIKTLGHFTCTNHPKRSWFARVSGAANGTFKVE